MNLSEGNQWEVLYETPAPAFPVTLYDAAYGGHAVSARGSCDNRE